MIRGRNPAAEQAGRIGGKQLRSVDLETLKEGQEYPQFRLRLIGFPCAQAQGGGVGQLGEVLLVYVDANSYHGSLNLSARAQHVLYEHPANLLAANIDVVGPFDGGLNALGFQIRSHGHRGHVIEPDRLGGVQRQVFKNNGKRQVLSRGREPGIAPLTAPRRLLTGGQDGAV